MPPSESNGVRQKLMRQPRADVCGFRFDLHACARGLWLQAWLGSYLGLGCVWLAGGVGLHDLRSKMPDYRVSRVSDGFCIFKS